MWNSLKVAIQRFFRRRVRPGVGGETGVYSVLLTIALGVLLAAVLIGLLELRVRPLVEQMAVHQVDARLTGEVNNAVLATLAAQEISYDKLICVQRDGEGAITAITSDMPQINLLRSLVVADVLRAVQEVDVSALSIPLGSVLGSDLFWASGPRIEVKSLTAGTVSAEVRSEFSSAGINQTLHRVVLDIQIPLTILLPGGGVKTQVSTQVCVAETVIVGKVPDTYLMLDPGGIN